MSRPPVWQDWQRFEAWLAGNGWLARLAYRLGAQRRVGLTQYRVLTAGRLGSAPELRIGFAADFHAGPLTHPSLLEQACAVLRDVRPDVLLYGGDFVSFDPRYAELAAELLATIPAPLGRYAVLGNHDLLADRERLVRAVERAGTQVLVNTNVRLARPFDRVWVCGLDDHLLGKPDACAAFAGAEGVQILLMHAPSGLLDLSGQDFDVAFCGHTHGGQLALPGGVPVYVPSGRLSRRHAYGRYQVGPGRTLVVTRGVGYTYLPFRLFSAPEVVVCTLASQAESG